MQMIRDTIRSVLIMLLSTIGMVSNFIENLAHTISTAVQRTLAKLQ